MPVRTSGVIINNLYQVYNTSISRHVTGKIVDNELTFKIPYTLKKITFFFFFLLFLTVFLQIGSGNAATVHAVREKPWIYGFN